MAFQKATKQQLKLRLGLFAPSGAGKTFTSLKLATACGPRIAVIDTENQSANKYIGTPGIPDFDVADVTYRNNAGTYVRELIGLIEEAQNEYDCLILDSLTHAWEATKDEVDAVAKRMKNPNGFAAWREGSTLWGQLVKTLLACRTHLICCARSKTEYVQEGKQVRKVGMAPELRDGMEYEFDIVGEMDYEHNLIVTKSRCHSVADSVTKCPDDKWMAPVLAWLGSGEAPKPDLNAEKQRLWKTLQGQASKATLDQVGMQCQGRTVEEQIEIMNDMINTINHALQQEAPQ